MKISYDLLSDLAGAVAGTPRGTYAGRGMFGRTCAAIVMDSGDLLALGANIAALEDEELRQALISGYETDSMGYDTIIYWRGVTCEDSPEDSDDWENW